MTQQEVVELIDRYMQDSGQWYHFVDWLDEQGYKPEELGFEED